MQSRLAFEGVKGVFKGERNERVEFEEREVKIENRAVSTKKNYLDPVTYIPAHAEGNAGHKDCEQGVIIEVRETTVLVLYCKSRSVQSTTPDDLVFG